MTWIPQSHCSQHVPDTLSYRRQASRRESPVFERSSVRSCDGSLCPTVLKPRRFQRSDEISSLPWHEQVRLLDGMEISVTPKLMRVQKTRVPNAVKCLLANAVEYDLERLLQGRAAGAEGLDFFGPQVDLQLLDHASTTDFGGH
jgi:hypothetical protein